MEAGRARRDFRAASVDPHTFFTGKAAPTGEDAREYGNTRYVLHADGLGDSGSAVPQGQFQAIVLTNAPVGSPPLALEIALERERGHAGRVLGPDGLPLAGATVEGLKTDYDVADPLGSAEFRVLGLVPGRPRRLTLVHKEKRLSGFLLVRGDEPGPYVVRLKPWATLSGRILDAGGRPRAGLTLAPKHWQTVIDDPAHGLLPGDTRPTNPDGRFHCEGLVAGLEYDGRVIDVKDGGGLGVVFEGVTLEPGETRDLGDVRAR